ncbi:MAG: regulatory iron-sulfur-containing complex subunit RicT [Candidatus Omnitrophota bacterium]
MKRVVQARLRDSSQTINCSFSDNIFPKIDDIVIFKEDRGFDYAQILSEPHIVLKDKIEDVIYEMVRIATPRDLEEINNNRQKLKEAQDIFVQKVTEKKINMKLIDAEVSFDGSKIIFYFSSDDRVDFRDLVKDLAKVFKARIELKQIGVRDEAKHFGGVSYCGRELCCRKFLKNFEPVTIKMAKDQNLPLNPSKISGLCGRLLCCLSYEHCAYKELSKGLPRIGNTVTTKEGKGKVINVDILKRKVSLQFEDGRVIEIDYNNQLNNYT